jgi:hypothetical protein
LFALSLPLNLQVLFPPPPPPPLNRFSLLHGSPSPALLHPQGPIGLLSCRSIPSSLTSWGCGVPSSQERTEAERAATSRTMS